MRIGEFGPLTAEQIAAKLSDDQVSALMFGMEFQNTTLEILSEYRKLRPVNWERAKGDALYFFRRIVDNK